MSQASARLAPPPAATPLTAATTGLGRARMARIIGLNRRSMAADTGMGSGTAPSGRVASRHALPYAGPMARILILVGTESGNAQMVADALKPVLEGAGHYVSVNDKVGTAADLGGHDVLLVV